MAFYGNVDSVTGVNTYFIQLLK